MSIYRLAVIEGGVRKQIDTNLEEFDFYALRIGPSQRLVREDSQGNVEFSTPLSIQDATLSKHAATLGQLTVVSDDLADVTDRVLVLEDQNVADRLAASINAAEVVRLQEEIDYLRANRPAQEYFVAGVGGQTMFTATEIDWDADNAIPDIDVHVNAEYQYQDLQGAQVKAYRKISTTQIEFSETIPEGNPVAIKQAWRNFLHTRIARPFFRNYVTGQADLAIAVGDLFDISTGKLSAYNNGKYLSNSPTIGMPVDRYVEKDNAHIELGVVSSSEDIFAFYHLPVIPSYKVFVSGIVGTNITVLPYVVGSSRLRVYRNGALMNTGGKGLPALQYSEASPTQITLVQAADSVDWFIFEFSSALPSWREDIDGLTGVDVNFTTGNYYTEGDEKLQIFRNGLLMVQSASLGGPDNAMNRYIENGINCVQLEVALSADEVITAVYL